MKVGVDFDGTIIDHGKTKIQFCLRSGLRINKHETNSNLFENKVGKEFYKQVSHFLYREGTIAGTCFLDVRWAIKQIRESGNEIFLVSARHPDSCHYATNWLRAHKLIAKDSTLDGILEGNIIFCTEKEKPEILGRLGANVYVDDKISVLKSLPPSIKGILFDDQHLSTRNLVSPNGFSVITSWRQIGKMFSVPINN